MLMGLADDRLAGRRKQRPASVQRFFASNLNWCLTRLHPLIASRERWPAGARSCQICGNRHHHNHSPARITHAACSRLSATSQNNSADGCRCDRLVRNLRCGIQWLADLAIVCGCRHASCPPLAAEQSVRMSMVSHTHTHTHHRGFRTAHKSYTNC